MKTTHQWLVSASLSLLFVSAADASLPGDYTAERALFIQAQQALVAGEDAKFEQLRAQLTDYPIAFYLDYQQLNSLFAKAEPSKSLVSKLNVFEQSSKDEKLTRSLTRQLQKRAADKANWELFTGLKKSSLAAEMPCATLQSKEAMSRLEGLTEDAIALWTEPKKYPKACAELLSKLEKRKTPPIKAIWQRIYAESVVHYLGRRDGAPVKAWIKARKNPKRHIQSGALKKDTALNRRILVDLVLLWSKEDPVSAMEHWLSVNDKYTFYKDRYYDTHRLLAMRGAYRRLPEGYEWLNSLQARPDDLELKEWRIRAALYSQDWINVLRSLKRLPKEEQEEDHWAYWEARAYEESGHLAQATTIFEKLSKLPTYHGFLAADKMSAEYAIADIPIEADDALVSTLAKNARLIRAKEFYSVDIPWQGRREWNAEVSDASPEKLAALTVLAERWELFDRAIYSAARGKQKQALSTRFPVIYQPEVDVAAEKNRVPAAWVYGVMRRESAYIRDVKSSAGAVGLMQLMPNTAKYVAKLQGEKNWKGDLTDAETNIGFGTFYLRHVMDKFDNNQVLATASYNAGPSRVNSWLPPNDMSADVWIDAIPYSETRRYVRAVMAYTAIYEWHLTKKPVRLSEKLITIPAAEDT